MISGLMCWQYPGSFWRMKELIPCSSDLNPKNTSGTLCFDPSDTVRLYLRPSVISLGAHAYNLLEVIQTTEPHFELLQWKSCKTDFFRFGFLVCLYVHAQIYVYMCNLGRYKFENLKSEVWQALVYLCLLCSWTVTYTVCSSVIHEFTKIKAKTTEHTVV